MTARDREVSGSLKSKLTPRNKSEIKRSVQDRFDRADQALNTSDDESEFVEQRRSRVHRKTYAVTDKALDNIELIKDRALNRKVKLTDSETVRLGLMLATRLTEDDLVSSASELEGYPKRSTIYQKVKIIFMLCKLNNLL